MTLLSGEELDRIRRRNRHGVYEDATKLLAHLDAITEAVRTMEGWYFGSTGGEDYLSRDSVLALLGIEREPVTIELPPAEGWIVVEVPVIDGIATLPDGQTVRSTSDVVRVPVLHAKGGSER